MSILDELEKPFPPGAIRWRVGATNKKQRERETGDKNARPTKGIALAYIDARDLMDRLDRVVGPENWQDRYPFHGCCEIGIKIDGEWVWKSDGAGQTDVEGEKGQFSDAFKRAGVKWGVGRYLYGLPNTWYDLDERGYKFKEPPSLPTWATPSGWKRIPSSEKKEFYETVVEALGCGDDGALSTAFARYDNDEKTQLWGMFDSKQRSAMKELMKSEAA